MKPRERDRVIQDALDELVEDERLKDVHGAMLVVRYAGGVTAVYHAISSRATNRARFELQKLALKGAAKAVSWRDAILKSLFKQRKDQ